MTVGWGFVGTGGIARTVATALELVPEGRLVAVASRTAQRAEEFGAEFGGARGYDDVAAMLDDPAVDAVYVATPHPQHHAAARAALLAGTPVLVEKPITATLAAAEDLVAVARAQGVFCMEAYWTRFLPGTQALLDVIASGAVGDVRSLHADLGFVPEETAQRFWDPRIGGGSLLDLGPYPVGLAHLLFGAPDRVQAVGTLTERGVDRQVAMALGWPTGEVAALSTTIAAQASTRAWIEGTGGWIEVGGSLPSLPRFTVHASGAEQVHEHAVAHGHRFMLEHVHECLARGLTESPLVGLDRTLEVMRVFETVLDQVGAVRHRELADG
ncbi:Gfo/Idh/MocA family oxidoreductase [Kineococcus sp. R8]|uniref:Gfo/Idh/MocA family protein n=1 Tax=Kineococcus siccus TaxID=2696567 RepID=UPI001412E293|nr:Gfo/Idh/MocA family oxidoreductase [Kineococcus siccus]NAZ82656.1 Gfo/Idh/MocA family oxidoreductase [Kineococcus siccus]